ncbi:MAG TPA: hypothetical protein VIM75_17220 [Ohtaekwangia sp.]|uniref:hypothetical protein n=1 Tax=Ohtaekwangia sp. TaxID=2066019 RepID=UPI002F924574
MNMEETQKKAFDFAADLTKQLITLSTAIITLTVTFSKDIIGKIDSSNRYLLLLSWVFFIISILLGLLTLMALTGNLDPIEKNEEQADGSKKKVKPSPILTITTSNVTGTGQWQVWTFLIAISITCWYGYEASSNESDTNRNDKHKNEYVIIRKSQLGNDSTVYIDTLYLQNKK